MRLLLFALLFLSGCTTVYVHESGPVSARQWDTDLFQCEAASQGVPWIPGVSMTPQGYADPSYGAGQGLMNLSAALGYRARRDQLFDQCMRSKGYQKE